MSLAAVIAACCQIRAYADNNQAKGIADGAGVWINMWNYPADADSYCLKLYTNGIRNIFIQTSRSNTDAICNPEGLGKLLDAAHRYQMRVIAWSFNELNNPLADADKVIAAAHFTNKNGQKLDAVAANMEKDLRPSKINVFCEKVKGQLGNSYPLIAVVYSPLNKAAVVSTIPWPLLAQQFPVLAVMSYWNSKYIATSGAYDYTLKTIKKIRELTGRPDVDIHIIGDGMGTSPESINQFLSACKRGGATSASLYPNQNITIPQLSVLSHYPEFFPSNGRYRLISFKKLTKNGSLSFPSGKDPSDSISRGHFYQLLTHRFYPNQNIDSLNSSEFNSLDISSQEGYKAMSILSNSHVATLPSKDVDIKQFLAGPLNTKEAIEIVAKIVSGKSQVKVANANSHTRNIVLQRKQNKSFFVQPAYAATENAQEPVPLTYLDAAQIVSLAAEGIK